MPTSSPANISDILQISLTFAPHSVLDIGIGSGKFGFLLREYLDIWLYADGKEWPPKRHAKIDGIEGCEKYVNAVHREVYDTIFIGDALTVLSNLPDGSYDLALLIDVLEHFSEEDAKKLITLTRKVAKRLLVVTPAGISPQDDSFGNEYERHRLTVRRSTLRELGFKSVRRVGPFFFAIHPPQRFALFEWRLENWLRWMASNVSIPGHATLVPLAKKYLIKRRVSSLPPS